MDGHDSAMRREIETNRRSNLQREKPLVYEKIIQNNEKLARGESAACIDFCYDYICNLHCEHCCNNRFARKDRKLTLADLQDLSAQAHALGLSQFNISGGEPLLFKELQGIIEALNPTLFHLSMSTNGHFLTEAKARQLKAWGMDKVRISVDSPEAAHHVNSGNSAEEQQVSVENAIANAKKAGLDVMIAYVVAKGCAHTKSPLAAAQWAKERNVTIDMILPKAVGSWEGKTEVLVTPDDIAFLKTVHEQCPNAHRDVYPAYGIERGCGTCNLGLHLTRYGDILPCPWIHISIGNVFEEPLGAIIARGLRIKWFQRYTPYCLTGEDRTFIDNVMSKSYGKPLPISWREAFGPEDFINGRAE